MEFSNILENALLPPVLKSAKKVRIKIKEYDQQTNNYIFDLNSLVNNYNLVIDYFDILLLYFILLKYATIKE